MLASQHTIVGSAIAVQTGSPLLGFFGGLLSHPLLDILPHVDIGTFHPDGKLDTLGRKDYIFLIIESVVTLGLLGLIVVKTGSPGLVMAGAFGGFTQDIVDYFPGWEKYFHSTRVGKVYNHLHNVFHYSWRPYTKFSLGLTFLLQIVITIGGLWASLQSF